MEVVIFGVPQIIASINLPFNPAPKRKGASRTFAFWITRWQGAYATVCAVIARDTNDEASVAEEDDVLLVVRVCAAWLRVQVCRLVACVECVVDVCVVHVLCRLVT